MELFDALNNLFSKRQKYPEDNEISDKIWIINSFVSMEKDLLEYIAYTSKYMFILGARYYRLLYRLIPQSFAPRNKYLKPKKEFDMDLIKRYSDYFNVGLVDTVDYLKLLKKKYDDKEIYSFVGLELKE